MKKTLAILIGIAVASAAVADLAVDFKTTAPLYQAGDLGGAYLASGSLGLLVWSPTDTSGANGVGLDGLVSGEFSLGLFSSVNAGIFSAGVGSYTDAEVGGADINSGYFFARLFENSAIGEGDYYIAVGLQSPTLTEYDAQIPSTIYSDSLNSSAAAIDAQNLQVVPEPATIGLMGVAGLGMFLARRKSRR
jgi:hypothetical protein